MNVSYKSRSVSFHNRVMTSRHRSSCSFHFCSIIRFLLFHICLHYVIGENEYSGDLQYSFLSQYSVSFERCQRVRYYSDEAAEGDDFDGPLATKQFIVFRLCDYSDWTSFMPYSTTNQQWCGNCNSNYGEYIIEATDYLDATSNYASYVLKEYCQVCKGGYQCPTDCQYLNNNDVLNAAEFIYCQKVGQTDDGADVYAGPKCSADGSTVRIGAFSDANCWYQMKDFDLSNILGSSIKHYLFRHATRNGRSCFSCANNDSEGTCDSLYSMSGKCELKHGFQGLMSNYAQDDQIYENQLTNEYDVCAFIDSITSGGYDNYQGDIVVRSKRKYIRREVTDNQRVSLLCLSLIVMTLIVYIMYLESYINIHISWLGFNTCRGDASGIV